MSVEPGSELVTAPDDDQSAVILPDDVAAMWAPMIAAVPEAEPGDVSGILLQIAGLDAENIAAPWEATNSIKAMVGRPFKVEAIQRRDSDYAGGLGWYLTVQATMLDTGESGIVTCSALGAMAQLVRLAYVGALPIDVVAVEAAKPTKRGFRPIHLRPYAAPKPVRS